MDREGGASHSLVSQTTSHRTAFGFGKEGSNQPALIGRGNKYPLNITTQKTDFNMTLGGN